MSDVIPFVVDALTSCFGVFTAIYTALGAVGYLLAMLAFVLFWRYVLFPLLGQSSDNFATTSGGDSPAEAGSAAGYIEGGKDK